MAKRWKILRFRLAAVLVLISASFFSTPSPPDTILSAAARATVVPAASTLVTPIELSALRIEPNALTTADDNDGSKIAFDIHGGGRLGPAITRTAAILPDFGILRQISRIRVGLTRAPPVI